MQMSKLQPPEITGLIPRRRLLSMLNHQKEKKLFCFMGMPATGKKTLAAQYVQQCGLPSLWINLERWDSEPDQFGYWLIQGLKTILDAQAFAVLPKSLKANNITTPSGIYDCQWARSFAYGLPDEAMMVITGMENIPKRSPIFRILKDLINLTKNSFKFILCTCSPPGLPIHEMAMNRSALILNTADILFTPAEMRCYLTGLLGMKVSDSEATYVAEVFEGWIGGLVLAEACISNTKTDQWRNKSGTDEIQHCVVKNLNEYFAKKIAAHLSPFQLKVVLLSAVFDIMDMDTIIELGWSENPDSIFKLLCKKNFFCFSADHDTFQNRYRFHRLFKKHLMASWSVHFSLSRQQRFFSSVIDYYKGKGLLDKAVDVCLRFKAYREASALIKIAAHDLIFSGRKDELARWLHAIPADMMKADHLLKAYQIIARDDLQSVSNANLIVDAYIHFRDHHDIGGCLVTMVALLKMMSFVSSVKMSSDLILSQAEMLLHKGFADMRIVGKADLLLGVGINTILFQGSIRAGQGILKAAYAIAKELDCKDIQLHALAGLNVACAHLGDFCEVRRFDDETELLFHQSSGYEQFIFYSGLISADLNSGRFESAEKYMIAAKGIAEQLGSVSIRSKIDFLEIVAAIRQSKYQRAIELLEAFLGFITTIGKVQLLGIAYSLMAQCQYSLSNLHPARQSAEKAVEILSDDITYAGHYYHRALELLGFIYTRLHDHQKAKGVIKKAIAYFSRESSWLFLAECYFANTLLAYDLGNANSARECFKMGLKITEEHGYNFFLIISPDDFKRLCETAFELLKENQTQKVKPLLQSRLMTQSPDYYDALKHHPNPGIRRQIRDIELKNHRIALPQIRVRTLGAFNVCRVGLAEEPVVFRGQMPATFFKLILALGGRSIPVDIIKEYLWPEADPRRVSAMFKSALYRLRKTLEPGMDKAFGSAFLKLVNRRLSIESELFDIDFFHFLSLKSRAQKLRAVDQKGAIKLYEAAFELYQGPFFPEEPYAPWAEEQRSSLCGSYIKMLEEMVKIYLRIDADDQAISCCEALLRADQLHEDAYQTLMRIYLTHGKMSKALKVFDTLKSVLKKELDIEPDERSNALYRCIVGAPPE